MKQYLSSYGQNHVSPSIFKFCIENKYFLEGDEFKIPMKFHGVLMGVICSFPEYKFPHQINALVDRLCVGYWPGDYKIEQIAEVLKNHGVTSINSIIKNNSRHHKRFIKQIELIQKLNDMLSTDIPH